MSRTPALDSVSDEFLEAYSSSRRAYDDVDAALETVARGRARHHGADERDNGAAGRQAGQRYQRGTLLARQHDPVRAGGRHRHVLPEPGPAYRSDTPPPWGRIDAVPKPPPESTKTSLRQRLTQHAHTRWPALAACTAATISR